MNVNAPGKSKLGQGRKILAADEARVAIFRPTPGFKTRRTFISSRLSAQETLSSASAVPYRGTLKRTHHQAKRM